MKAEIAPRIPKSILGKLAGRSFIVARYPKIRVARKQMLIVIFRAVLCFRSGKHRAKKVFFFFEMPNSIPQMIAQIRASQ